MRLNLGCGDDIRGSGWINCDIVKPCDQLVDLRVHPWPWLDSSVDEVMARDIFEHIPDKRGTMNELFRILKPNGRATIIVPCAAHGAGADQDPTHEGGSRWTGNDFEYYEKGNFARERFRHNEHYGVKADFRVVSVEHECYRGKWDEVWKVTAILEALKYPLT